MSLLGLSEKGKNLAGFYKGAFKKGLSRTKTYFLARELNLKTYAKTDMLRDMRVIQEAKTVFEPMKFIRKDHLIGEKHYKTSSKTMERKYATVIDYTYKNRGEEEVRQSYYTIRHDTLLKRGEIESVVKAGVERDYEVVDVDVLAPREGYKSLN